VPTPGHRDATPHAISTRMGSVRYARPLAVGLAVAALLAGCGSGNSSTSASRTETQPAATQTGTPAKQGVAVDAFDACMTKAHWRATANAPSDRAWKVVSSSPGYAASASMSDGHGDRVAVAFFASPAQAEQAQQAAGKLVPGDGHSTATSGVAVAWINYSGKLSVDQRVADCAGDARG
jgi:hypothetical protein